jgi:hypothetical protein
MGGAAGVGRDEAGAGWQEFVAPDDLPYLLHWFAEELAGEEGGHAVFRALIPATRQWVCCVWSKERLRGNWLVVGETIEVAGWTDPVGLPFGSSEAGREVRPSEPDEIEESEEKNEGGGGGDLIR